MQSAYGEELDLFREGVRAFFRRDVEPRLHELESGTDERFWKDAARAGLLGVVAPEEYGGPGADPLAMVIISEELGRSPAGAVLGSCLNSDMTTMFMLMYGNEEQKRQWLPRFVTGEVIQATALSEAGSGSDAGAMRTTAVRDSGEFVINGSKMFISNGNKAGLIYVHAKLAPSNEGPGGPSIFLVPGDTPGVTKRYINTMSFRGGDTAELFFDNVRVPYPNLLGAEGQGLKMFQPVITLDRLQICGRSQGAAEGAFALTLEYVRQRKIFGQRLVDMQNTQFKLAEMETEINVGRAFLDELVRKYRAGEMTARDASMLKIWLPEMEQRVIDGCLQFWGGTGFMDESTISRMYTAARVQRIHAGATELQKAMLGRGYAKG
ncbi:MAG: acyl-CoA dehydrogenase family protein [Steroidobacteraceae bacterium]